MLEHTIARKLESTADALRMLRKGGAVGRAVVARLAARHSLDPSFPLGAQLAAPNILTVEEGAWLDEGLIH
jgi:hypothetical protein